MNIESMGSVLREGHPLGAALGGNTRFSTRHPVAPNLDGLLGMAQAVLSTSADRAAVVERLRRYNREIGNPRGEELCDQLADPRCLVVTAGHQPGVFGGPLMVFAKAAGAANLAASLMTAWDGPVVPLFWNHSEDHDIDEIKGLTVMKQGSPARLRAPVAKKPVSLESVRVTEELITFAEEALEIIGMNGDRQDFLPVLGEPFASWTARVLMRVLKGTPLLHAEPHVLRPLLGDFFLHTVADVQGLGDAARAGAGSINDLGHTPQVDVKDSSQLFLLGRGGERSRLRFDGAWSLAAKSGFADELVGSPEQAVLEEVTRTQPAMFSTNVLLRPAAMQHLLPVVCHVCGPGEAAYFAQMPEIFAWAGSPLPAVVPRPSVTLLGPREDRTRVELGLGGDWVLQKPEDWAVTTDDGAAEDEQKRNRRERHHLAQWVRPRGRPQERLFGPLALMAGQDPGCLGSALARLDPWEFRHQVITLKEGDHSGGRRSFWRKAIT